MKKTKKGIAVLLLVAILFSMSITNVFAAESKVKEYNAKTDTLTLSGDFSANGCDGAIYAHDGANLTINGTGTVHGKLCGAEHKPGKFCGYAMAVWAKNNTKITINGGVYTNDTDTVSDDKTHVDLIYASNGSEITINGGTFKCSTPKWTLNGKDKSDKPGEEVAQSVITVKGGTFYKFDPSNTEVGEGEVVVPEGYKVVQNGDWYTVIKTVYTKETNTLNIQGNLSANGCDGVIYAHDDANLTINGSGTVHGKLCGAEHKPGKFCGYAMAVWAKNNTKITINGGVYTNDADTVSDDKTHVDLIYASNGSEITINGGTFRSSTPKWTLNGKDKSDKPGEEVAQSVITVKGGTFYKFDPSNTEVVEGEVVVPEGYKVVKNGDWYTVYKEHTITVKDVAGGKIIVREVPTSNTVKEIDKAISGETVEVVVEPAEGYKFKGISGVEGLKDVAEYAYQFVMPNKDIVLTPVFEKITTEAEVPNNVANAEKVEEMLVETLKENEKLAEIIKDKNVEIKVEVKEKEVTSSEKEAIETAASKEVADIKVANYIDITIYVKDADNGKNLGNLETVKEAITFTVPVPEDLPELAEGFRRIFYIVREHDGDIDVWEVKESDGKLSFESDKFSTYAIAYKDVENSGEGTTESKPEDNKTENKPITPDVPKTGDNVVAYIALALVAITGMGVAIKVRKRK